jgi:hypothetical protein
MSCSSTALDIITWVLPVEEWEPWMTSLADALKPIELNPYIRNYYALHLLYVEAQMAIKEEDRNQALTILHRIESLPIQGSFRNRKTSFIKKIKRELLLTEGNAESRIKLKNILFQQRRQRAKKNNPFTCISYWEQMRIAETLSQRDQAIEALKFIVKGECRIKEFHHHLLRTKGHLKLAQWYFEKNDYFTAKSHIDLFYQYWPKANEGLALSKQALNLLTKIKAQIKIKAQPTLPAHK